ncbi:MAG TPA: oligosaccharide flippase family protein, partial [Anaerolineae bacterium]
RLLALPSGLGVIVLVAHLLGYGEHQQGLIAVAGLAIGLSSLADLLRMVFQGLQKMILDVTTRVVEKVVALLALGLCIYLRLDLTMALAALAAGALAGLLACWYYLRKLAIHPAGLDGKGVRRMLSQSAPLLGSLGVIGLTSRLPLVVLSQFRPTAEVGLYSAAFSLVDPLSLVAMAAATALLPVISGMIHGRDEGLARTHESVLATVLLLGLPVTACLALFSQDLVLLVYGKAYGPANLPMAILAMSSLCYTLAVYLHVYLIAAGAQTRFFFVTLAQLGVSVAANLLLASRYGAIGTAASVVLTQLSGLLLIIRFTSPLVRHRVNRRGTSAVLATIVMAIGVTAAHSLALWLRAPLAVVLYAVGLVATGGLTQGDLKRGCALMASRQRPRSQPLPLNACEKIQ